METAISTTDATTDLDGSRAPASTRMRWARGGLTASIGCALAFLLMAHDAQLRWGVPLATVCTLVATWGIMDLLRTFDDPEDRVARSMTLRALAPALGRNVGAIALFGGSLMLAQCGAVNQWVCGVLVTGSFVLWVAAVFDLGVKLGPWALDEAGLARALHRRHGFWVLVASAALYLPTLGIYSLWDPWETHYGEVARGILARDDWVSLWWSYQGWFFSKPILELWAQALAMGTLGTGYHSDQMLIGAGGLPIAHPEWVVRMPNVLFAMIGAYFLYKGVASVFGRRAGLIGALVLVTMPDWYFLAHQSMTDMPCVAAIAAAMGLVLLSVNMTDERVARVYEVKVWKTTWRLSAWHLVFGAVIAVALPQILYLFTRNVELVLNGSGPHGFRAHWDEFRSGSGGNCGIPGNESCVMNDPSAVPKGLAHPDTFGGSMHRLFGAFEPAIQALVWTALLGFVLFMSWNERRVRRLVILGAWFFAAIATMAKGPMGLCIPMGATFLWIATTRRWADLARMEIPVGLLISVLIVAPWCVASFVRHGTPFTDELFFHDMFNRAFDHVHDTNEGDDTSIRFYIWQLGYALFPWTGLAPLGLLYGLRRADGGGDANAKGTRDVTVILFGWFLVVFGLMSFMGTKFHHYIFPGVPALAMLIGIAFDEILKRRTGEGARNEQMMIGVAAFAGAIVTLLVGRDLILKPAGADQPGAIRFLHLFTYNYRRAWPDTVDFSKALTVLTVAGALGVLAFVSWRFRHRAVYVFGAVACLSAIWGLDVYMMRLAPHWGQRETIQAYYENRSGPDEWLVAYQMNWKGENFYTGNRIPVFVSTGAPFTTWMKAQREKGAKVMYFITEHGRVSGLKNEVHAKEYRELTDKALDNKFILVRAEL